MTEIENEEKNCDSCEACPMSKDCSKEEPEFGGKMILVSIVTFLFPFVLAFSASLFFVNDQVEQLIVSFITLIIGGAISWLFYNIIKDKKNDK